MDWVKALESGHRIQYGIRIEGIPHAFVEDHRPRVDDTAEPTAPTDHTTSDALWIDDGASVSIELDRRNGIASASRLTFSIDSDRLGSLEAALFGAPTKRALLLGYVDDDTADPASGIAGAEMPFRRGDLADWDATGAFYIGLERIEYTSKLLDWPTGEFLRGLTRGVAGRVHTHSSLGRHDGHAYATDRPQAWTGRMVTVYEHLVSPAGHAVAESWCTVGSGCRELWVGYLDALPLPSVAGWTFGAHALVRRLAVPFGRPARGKVPFADPRQGGGWQRVWITPADVVTITFTRPAETSLTLTLPSLITDGVQPLDNWAFAVSSTLAGLITAAVVPAGMLDATAPVAVEWGTRAAVVHLIAGATPEADAVVQLVASTSWWMPGTYPMQYTAGRGWSCSIPYRAALEQFGVEVELDADTADEDVPDIPAIGAVRLQQGDVSEIVSYRGAAFEDFAGTGRYAGPIYITERDLARTGVRVDLLDGDQEVVVTFLVGAVGTVRTAFLTLATSSGMGINGAFDTAPRQHGLYIPADRIDAPSFEAYPLDRDVVALVAEERVSLADLVGGWLALHGYCVGQRRQRDGVVRLVLERTTPAPGDIIDASKVLQDGHELASPMAPPNEVVVKRGLRGGDARDEIVRDRPRVAIEGAERWEYQAPGIRLADAVDAAADFLRIQEGTQALGLSTPLQAELQAGDPIDLRTAHPLVWSSRLSTRSPASILGRVLAWTRDMGRDQAKALALLEGLAEAPAYLCPASEIVSVAGAVVTLEAGAGDWYRAGEKVMSYIPGVDEVVVETPDDIFTAHTSTTAYQAQSNDIQVYTVLPTTMTHFSFKSGISGSGLPLRLYWRSGTSAGFTSSSAGWTLVYEQNVTLVAGTIHKFALGVPISLASGLNGFYLTAPTAVNRIRYVSGSNVETSNGDVSVWTRTVNNANFSTTYANYRCEFGIDYFTTDDVDAEVIRTISTIAGDVVTLNAALPGDGSEYEAGGLLTYPTSADASVRQAAFTYHDDSEWR